jgi:hypothetical protein
MDSLKEEQLAELKELVKARLSVLPKDISVSVGSSGSFSRKELIEHIEAGDAIGQKFMEIDLEFLQSLKTGEIYQGLNYV